MRKSGARKNMFRSWIRFDANCDANVETTSSTQTESAAVAARNACSGGSSVRARASSSANATSGKTPR